MASVTPVTTGTSDLFKPDTAPTSSASTASSQPQETAAESPLPADSVQLSLQALQLLETSRLLEAAGAGSKAFNATGGLMETQQSQLSGPITLAPQPELAAALEQAYGLFSSQIPRPYVRPRRPVDARPKGRNSRENPRDRGR
ncbi:MAG TPA: hypothetical protein VG273_17655 [Bryobacteraceae bacterium]|jgi:hypothetical protein|nr:hypothetical protein [Bryobacteraceae bacterium]